jgi:hypothetical protein
LDKFPRTNEGLFCVSGGTGHQSEAVEPRGVCDSDDTLW